jgi:CPW-WPC domain-containing protein
MYYACCCRETPEQKALEDDLADAMKTPSTIGKGDRTMPAAANICDPDFSVCPSSTEKKGVVCVATDRYVGPCAPEMPVLSMTADQAFAFARACKVTFPCVGAERSASFLSLPAGYMDLPAEAVADSSLVSSM